MAFIIRLLLIAAIFYLIFWVARGLFRSGQPSLDNAQELVSDALTGVYFDKKKAFTLSTQGRTLYFISQANRDAWLAIQNKQDR
ncbi:MAG: hypothetical protein LBK52_03020 [Deltaproteobacteria bacterium]|jgi:hypothetical protein|nr:hypothetical protein [Deltaproteobacteria bacterium]